MAENLYFSRDSKLYVEFDGAVWEVPILDGFSFSQATNTSEITLSEMEGSNGQSRRGRRMFTDSLAPAEWSFSTYVRPILTATQHQAVEDVLWAIMAGADTWSSDSGASRHGDFLRTTNPAVSGGAVFTQGTGKGELVFTESNRSALGECNLYFVMETSTAKPMVYKLSFAAINEASIDFEVDGIAMINWSGFAKQVNDLQTEGSVSTGTTVPGTTGATAGDVFIETDNGMAFYLFDGSSWVQAYDDGINSTTNFIRNRLTQLEVTTADTDFNSSYSVTLTGGNITISNNISYLVPEELGKVNVPIEHVTGARTVSGNFTSYLVFDDASNVDTTSAFFSDMTDPAAGLSKVVNDFSVTFKIGGTSASLPRLNVVIPKCHISVPAIGIEDVVSIDAEFGAYTDNFDTANEVSLEYIAV